MSHRTDCALDRMVEPAMDYCAFFAFAGALGTPDAKIHNGIENNALALGKAEAGAKGMAQNAPITKTIQTLDDPARALASSIAQIEPGSQLVGLA